MRPENDSASILSAEALETQFRPLSDQDTGELKGATTLTDFKRPPELEDAPLPDAAALPAVAGEKQKHADRHLQRLRREASPLPEDAERVLLSASTALDASRYWYIQGSELQSGASRYAGERNHDSGDYTRRFDNKPSAHAFPGAPLDAWDKSQRLDREGSDRIIVPVEANGKIKGYAVFDRKNLRAWDGQADRGGFSPQERELARFIVQEQAEYFPPQTRKKFSVGAMVNPKEARRKRFAGQVAFLEGLNERLYTILNDKAPDQGKHIKRVSQLYTDFIREMVDSGHKRPFKVHVDLTPDELTTLEYAAILHDAAKVLIAKYVLSHPRMEQWMYDCFKMHPWQSRDIVDQPRLDGLPIDIRPVVVNHHMQPNGAGKSYPFHVLDNPFSPQIDDELSTDDKTVVRPMNQWAAIMAIVDKFEAITGRRSYQDQKQNVMFGPPVPDGEKPDLRKMGALDALYDEAISGAIHPEYFLAFINSDTFRHYVEHAEHLGLDAETKTPRALTQREITEVYDYVDKINRDAEGLRVIDAGGSVPDEDKTLLVRKILDARKVDQGQGFIMYDRGPQEENLTPRPHALSPTHNR